jgi:Ca2+-binding RTX toxin-like protein
MTTANTSSIFGLPEFSKQGLDEVKPLPVNTYELVIFDAGVDHVQQLIEGVKPGIDWAILNANQDGIEQITRILANYPEITTLHLISHGAPGCLFLGNTQLNLETLEGYTTQLQSWFALLGDPPSVPLGKGETSECCASFKLGDLGESLKVPLFKGDFGGSLLLYGCKVAAGDSGVEFIHKLHNITQANIAASRTLTGNSALGGDWELEITLGQGQFVPAFTSETLVTYSSVLDDKETASFTVKDVYDALPEFVQGFLGNEVKQVFANNTTSDNIQFGITVNPENLGGKFSVSYTKPFMFDLRGLSPSVNLPVLGNLETVIDSALEKTIGDSVEQLPGSQALFYKPTIEIYEKNLGEIGITLSGKLVRDESAFGLEINDEKLDQFIPGLLSQVNVNTKEFSKEQIEQIDDNTITFSLQLIYYLDDKYKFKGPFNEILTALNSQKQEEQKKQEENQGKEDAEPYKRQNATVTDEDPDITTEEREPLKRQNATVTDEDPDITTEEREPLKRQNATVTDEDPDITTEEREPLKRQNATVTDEEPDSATPNKTGNSDQNKLDLPKMLAIAKVEDFNLSDLTPSVLDQYIEYIDIPIGSAEFMIATKDINYAHSTLGAINLPMGLNAVGVLDFKSIKDDSKSFFKMFKDAGLDTAALHLGMGIKNLGKPTQEVGIGLDALIQGDFSLLPEFLRPFDLRFHKATANVGVTLGTTSKFNLGISGNLRLDGYDPTKDNEPTMDLFGSLSGSLEMGATQTLNLKGALQAQTLKEEKEDGTTTLVPGGAWENPFSLPASELRNIAIALEGSYQFGAPAPVLSTIGYVGDLKFGDYNFKLAQNVEIKNPQKFAFALTALEPVRLRHVISQMLVPGPFVDYALAAAAENIDWVEGALDFVDETILAANVVSADNLDANKGVDKLIKRQEDLLIEKQGQNASQEEIEAIQEEIAELKQDAIDAYSLIQKREEQLENDNLEPEEIDKLKEEIDVLEATLDPLIQIVPTTTQIAQTTLPQGLGINARVNLWGAVGMLGLNANPFSQVPSLDGFLRIPQLDVGNLGYVIIEGIENPVAGGTDTDLNIELKVTTTEQYFRGDGRIEIFGHEVAKADFKITPSGVEIKDFDFDLSVMKLDVNNLAVYSKPKNIDGVNVIAQGDGSFDILSHQVAATDFQITTSGIDINYFNLDVGIFELNVNDFFVDFNNMAARGQANVKVFNQEVAAVEFDISSQKFELENFDLDFGIVDLDVDNLILDSTGNASGSGSLEILGKEVANAEIETVGEQLTVNGNVDLFGLIKIDNAKIEVKSSDNLEVTGTLKFLGQELSNTNVTIKDNQLTIKGGLSLDLPSPMPDVYANLTITSDGTLEGSKVNVDTSLGGFDVSLNSLNSIDDLIVSVGDRVGGGKVVEAFNDTVEFAAETWNDTVDIASDTFNALGSAWNYGVDFISNTFKQVTEKISELLPTIKYNRQCKWGVCVDIPYLSHDWIERQIQRVTNDPNWSQQTWFGDGNDGYNGEGGNDTIGGGNGEDHLIGGDGDDRVYGGNGNDKLEGGRGNDYLNGDGGNDLIYGNENDDHLIGGDGDDRLYGGGENDKLEGWRGRDYLNGEWGNDLIYGNEDNDHLIGGDGDDRLYGGGENDKLEGWRGRDYLHGEWGNDQLYGHEDNDSLYGGDGEDLLHGDDGDDELHGENGRDVLRGGNGNDLLHGNNDSDLLEGESGNDTLRGGSGSDKLQGGEGDDWLEGEWDNDLLYGDAGNDSMHGGDGNDEIHGYFGQDTIDGGNGNDVLYGQQGGDRVYGGEGNDVIYGEDDGKQGQTYDGSDDNDTLDGGAGDDYIVGGVGNDILYGNTGEDYLDGGDGHDEIHGYKDSDFIQGGSGSDTLYGQQAGDLILGGDGDDHIYGEDDGKQGQTYSANENNNDTLGGGKGNDYIYGGLGNDLLNGGEGNDTLDPGIGNDTISGGEGNDYLVLSGAESDYTFTETETGWTITDNRDNSEKTVTGVEEFLYKLEGTVANGPLANATAFIDTNGNFQRDAGETQTTTDNNGEYDFAIDPEALDRNGDGEISPQEAQIVVTGGIDTTTGLPGAIPLISQVGSTSDHATTSPLTTLKTVLASQDIEAEQVETLLNKISGLDLASLSQPLDNFDPYAAVGESDTSGIDIASGHIKVMNLFLNGTTFLEAAGYQGEDAQIQVIIGLGEVLQTVNSFNLSQNNDLQKLLTQLTEQLNLSVESEVITAVSELVAESNHLVDDLVEEALSRAVSDVLPTINPIKQAVYSNLPEVTAQLVKGEITTEEAQTQLQDLMNSDTYLVQYALNENRTVTVTASNEAVTPEENIASEASLSGEANTPTSAIVTEGEDSHGHFIITLGEAAPAQGLKILYTLSGTATLGQDYESENGQFGEIIVAPGATQAIVDLTMLDDEIAERPESITINLRYVGDGYVLDPNAQSAVIDITDNDEANAANANTGSSQTGTFGDDTLVGTAADDKISGSYGDDLILGLAGNDELMGAAGDDTVFGGQGNDNIEGNFGANILHGNLGDDIIAGGADNDIIEGHEGSDQLQGDDGDDYVQGNEGNDVIKGGLGNDLLKGNQDNDWLVAGSGDDILMGGQGVDLFNGGDGADIFFFNVAAEGGDLILDFDPAQGDRIQVSEIGFNTTSLEDFSFVAGTLYFQDEELALIQNNGQTYNHFADLSEILEIVSQPTPPEPENTAVLSANITPRVPDINLVENPETTILDEIIQRGQITVGTSTAMPAFDLEFARTLAAALFGDAGKVETVTSSFPEGWNLVADGSVDLVARRSTETLGRDATLNVDFSPTYFYDHQAIVVRNDSGIENVLDLNGRTIGVVEGTTALGNLQNLLGSEGIEFTPQQFSTSEEMIAAYDQGLIDAYSRDRALILDHLNSLPDSENHRLLEVEFSKEPIALALPENDSQWADIVRWVNYVPVQAEEFGIDSQNIDQLIAANTDENENNDSKPQIRRFLGLEGNLGEALGLPDDFAVQVIRQVGNYSEIYERHFPELDRDTTNVTLRDRNLLSTGGGLLYSPPFSGSPIESELVNNDTRNLLAEVLERGTVKLGLPGNNPGFAVQQADGEYAGFDVDLGRAIAAAIFGDTSKLEIEIQSFKDSFANTANGVVDVSAMGITHNLVRDASLGIDYSPTYLYTGQGILVKADSGIDMLPALNGRRIGVLENATALQNLQDNLKELGGTFTPVTYGSNDELFSAYEAGDIDAVSTDLTILSARIPTLSNPEEHQLLDDVLSKEPLALITDENQSEWADIVRWVTHTLVQAEEYGITSENIDEFIANNIDDNPDNNDNSAIRQFLGLEGNIGGSLGLPNDFAVNIVKAVGNYGEIYDRHFNSDVLRRGNNELATNFGLQYAPPFSGAGDANVVDGTPEDDNLEATNASEHIYGYQGNDLIMAQDGSDFVYGGQGNDTVQAGNGNDYIWGNAGNDWLNGNLGNDRINGGDGDDELYGGQGDDLVIGGVGNNTVTGGLGQDQFVLTTGSSSNLITDFTDGEDLIVLEEGLTFEQLTIETAQNATIVKFNNEILATLNGVESSLMTADDFNNTVI